MGVDRVGDMLCDLQTNWTHANWMIFSISCIFYQTVLIGAFRFWFDSKFFDFLRFFHTKKTILIQVWFEEVLKWIWVLSKHVNAKTRHFELMHDFCCQKHSSDIVIFYILLELTSKNTVFGVAKRLKTFHLKIT